MSRVYYNKLIRDKIPEKIRGTGSDCETRELGDEEFETELLKKVEEEASGVVAATTKEEITEELADVLDVIEEIKELKGITAEAIEKAQKANRDTKGGFMKRLFLIWSSDDGYKTNEKK